MASVTLDTVYLADVTDLANQLQLDVVGLPDDDEDFGEVRSCANGRQRSITRAGNRRTLQIETDWVTRDEVATLRSWKSRTVLYRDSTGRKLYGVYFKLSTSPYVLNDMERASFTLTEITYSEAV